MYAVATGEGWRQRFIERWKVEPDQVIVVENGSEMVTMLERKQLSAFRDGPNSTEPVTIIYIGAFEPWHGLSILQKAVAQAIAQGVSVRLLMIGSGTELEHLKQLTLELNLTEKVIFTGQLTPNEVAPYLAGADIAVSPYCGRVEYSGLKLLDYKAAGLATIASGKDNQPAILKHGQTGWIVPPGDQEALCQAIVHLVNNIQLRRQIGRQARVEAEKYHSWQNTTQELETLFKQALAE
jgi:glycosyltransferase involved in cell wall biosynthesis